MQNLLLRTQGCGPESQILLAPDYYGYDLAKNEIDR